MANIYCFISDEPFLLQENRLIEINKLKKEGYLNRKIFFADKKFNWDTFDSNDSLSLFEDKELLDIRINGFAPTKDCLNYLEDFSGKAESSKIIILSIENVTIVKGSAWFKKISSISLIDSSSKDIFSFSRSFINSNAQLFNKLLNQLLIEKVPLTLMLWSLNRELSFIEALQANPTMKVPGPFDYVSDLKNKAKTISEDSINKIKIEIAKLDRLIKSENNEKLIKVRFNTLMSYV